jgi:hypothetical protein
MKWGARLLGLLGLTAGSVAGTASAYVPSDDLVQAIERRNLAIGDADYRLWRANFSQPLVGPDGIPGPDGTPDGRGAFQFYTGVDGLEGAIYVSRSGSHGVYGDILASWAAAGYENGYGYPSSEELDAGDAEIRAGCKAGDRAQWFWTYVYGGNLQSPFLACWDGETKWFRPVTY